MARQSVFRPQFAKRSYKRVQDFSGGLNNKFSPFLLADNELSDIQNFNYEEKGTLQTRRGSRRHYQSAFAQGPVRGLYNFRRSDGTSRLVIAAEDKLFYDTPHFLKKWDAQADWKATGTSLFGAANADETAGSVVLKNPSIPPTFARPSVAYLTDGTQVAQDVPRFEQAVFGQGLRVEEPTTNLLTANQSSVETDATGFSPFNGATISRVTTEFWHGQASLQVVLPGSQANEGVQFSPISVSPSNPYTVTVHVKASAGATLRVVLQEHDSSGGFINASTVNFVGTGDWQEVVCTRQFGASGAQARLFITSATTPQAITFWYDGGQLEAKPYATSWTLGGTTRAAESFYATLPTPLPQEFTAMGWFVPDWGHTVGRASALVIVSFHQATPTFGDRLTLLYSTSQDQFQFAKFIGGVLTPLFSDNAGGTLPGWNPGDPIAWAIRQDALSMRLSLKIGATIKHYFLDNAEAFAADIVRVYIGSFGHAAGFESNALHDDVVVLSRALSDAEVEAYFNAADPAEPEFYTMALFHFDGTLDAASLTKGVWISEAVDVSQVSEKDSGVVSSDLSVPQGATATIYSRTSTDQQTWSAWEALGPGGSIASPAQNYMQLKAEMELSDPAQSPELKSLQMIFDNAPSVTQLASGLDSNARVRFTAYNDTLWIVNGVNAPKKWDGTTFAEMGGSPPIAPLILAHKN
ncbi:MAG TPA: hypothetical protein VF171_07285, partial [Trueperaceae bacterium]